MFRRGDYGGLRLASGVDFKFRRWTTGDYGWHEMWILSFGGGLRGTTAGSEVWILSFGGGTTGDYGGLRLA